ncbi:hypothetical protein QKU48_gp0963 [Fadolivirus algeromassiliense]|jgi:hypothetical protein|uniref:Uncharacterized protein n=1 Tax=Fadolivirus FV1/VV64 TaxID=3070911 RepID=A0A7D3R1I7_9VIRU|nr:hypothetical protein QKU48_gp0963 [Fadolivirus algeromassiliense]QKF94421.1 hypothetical protein Fadolivirus_1_963 [Fadolivirus FV1/VV64]
MHELYRKVIYFNNNDTSTQLSILKSIDDIYGIKLFIFNNLEQKSIIEQTEINCVKVIGTSVLEKHFDLHCLFGGSLHDIDKLIVIYELTENLLNSKFIKYLLMYGKQYNITTVILNFYGLTLNTVTKHIDAIIFHKCKQEEINSIYDKYFIKYPPYDTFKDMMLSIQDNEILLYNKNTERYIEALERFNIIELKHNDNQNNDDQHNDNYNNEIIIRIEI